MTNGVEPGRTSRTTGSARTGDPAHPVDRPTIRIDARPDAGKPIGRDLFGAFFEDLNYAADGGLYAELVQNRSFEYSPEDAAGWHALTAWELVELRGGQGSVGVATTDPLHPANPHYAVLEVTAGDGVGLTNHGFDGIPVQAGASYVVSLHARRAKGPSAPLTVRLEGARGTYAQASIGEPTDTWTRYETTLTSSATDPEARLVVLATRPGTIHLDLVSLFPEATFRGRPGGLRSDLAQAIADLKPKFLRFPGGCVAHGLGLGNMYRWKDTIGPLEGRRQQRNLWGYHQSAGLGYFEYFQFCEDIGAKPLPVVAAGVCCQNTPGGPQGIPLDEMPAYVREILDLVEYANGPADSVWGARRAEAGHPEPFGLEYLGVGNEDAITPEFRDRFEIIHRALRERHPEITVVGTVGPNPAGEDFDLGWEFARKLGLAMVDEHMYLSPRWFLQNTRRYDDYDRAGPKVYVGEWASRGSTLRNALAEAAFMNGLERNGDVVALASYAPLLAKSGHTQWNPDLIYFDNTSVRLTPSYHAQRMHSTHHGDVWLPHTVTGAPAAAPPPDPLRGGGVLLTTTDTQADYRGLRVTSGAADYTVELQARKNAGAEGFVIGFGAVDTPDHYLWSLGGWHNQSLTLHRRCDGFVEDLARVPGPIETGRWYDIRIEVTGPLVRCFLDNVLVHEVEDDRTPPETFSVSCVRDSATGDLLVKIVNLAPDEFVADIGIDGADRVSGRATRTVLAGDPVSSLADPHTSVIEAGGAFDCVLPPHSFTALRLRADGEAT
ncbi:alpha-L-arabinofuranosidase C-terminal domain-containing protein [Streptomyces sp. GQFP]|uniref:alpha-L-arabinofuranosidase C-terminal domain-containing protein n=1 Tax=Streptomyces sp. GQFP TaxID=2907545 RepID=UPI001F332642|nr:alpha-L-arabinofuranosidase C-terminal domain-containing protein [Streptomyces sp. GQFP]UIX29204.1 carbohydrate binding domain-containing protein [Streptomyces sp. GQFP]